MPCNMGHVASSRTALNIAFGRAACSSAIFCCYQQALPEARYKLVFKCVAAAHQALQDALSRSCAFPSDLPAIVWPVLADKARSSARHNIQKLAQSHIASSRAVLAYT